MHGLHLWEFLTRQLPCPACPSAPARPTIPDKATDEDKDKLLADYDDLVKSYESQFSAYSAWMDEDARARSILIASMEDEFAAEIVDFERSHQMWSFLRDRYEPTGHSSNFVAIRQEQLMCHGDLTVDELYTQLSAVWRQIDSLRHPLSPSTCEFCQGHQSDIELQRTYAFLTRLRDEYEPLRAQLLARHPFVSLMEALGDVRNEETRLRTAGLLPSVTALAARSSPSRPAVPPSLPSSASVPPSTCGGVGGLHCDYCGKDGHVEAFCYRKKKARRSQTRLTSQTSGSTSARTSQTTGSTSAGVSQRSSTDPVFSVQGTLAKFSCPGAQAQNGVAERNHRHLLETARALMLASSVPPHFWAEAVSTATYLINIQPSSALGGAFHSSVFVARRLIILIFGCLVVFAMCFLHLVNAPRYSAEHKGYRCWDPVGRRMRISWDVVFDESRHFYPRPSLDASLASLVDPLSFLFIPDTAIAHIPSGLVPSPTVPSSAVVPPSLVPPVESPSESSSLPPDYTTKPPVTQVFTCRSASISSEPSDEPSSGPSEPFSNEPLPAASSLERLIRRGYRSCQPIDRYGFGHVTILSEPFSYRDAILHLEWQLAMAEEIAALERTGTWDLVPTPSHVRPITCKWVYKVKTRSDGSLERYKARLFARGFQQEHGRDYDETFAPVAHMTIVRALLAVASVREWSISQLDVKNAFLNGELREEVYMQPPPGYSVPRLWFVIFVALSMVLSRLLGLGFSALLLWSRLLVFLPVLMILLCLYTHPLVVGLLDRASITDHKTEETPMELNLHLSANDGEPLDDPTRYHHIVGSLVYLGVTRPDISYSVHILSQFVSAPTQLHYSHLLRVLRYLGTMSRRLFFPCSSSLQLQAYCDATWASDSSNRRSLSTYCVFLGGSLIAWKTNKQTAISRSSTEVDLRAMALVTAKVTWLRDFGVSVSIPTPLLTDSTGAISITRDPVKHELTKHIGVDAYYTRAQVQDGVVTLRYMPSELQLADFLTKAQTRAQHKKATESGGSLSVHVADELSPSATVEGGLLWFL
ncbi:hypothetical protein U9M48_003107 [Paspalum notatum var. saurae]|uniref:Integrase catalytic domain-containing protein n=1 Tax=Paspalum notatum var. saurae TaxID=547442 RepID=A0AAQ3PS38_PASNO